MNETPTATASAITLFAATAVATMLVIAVAHELRGAREQSRFEIMRTALRSVPMVDHDNDPIVDEVTGLLSNRFDDIEHLYFARKAGQTVGVWAIAVKKGYGGPIRMLISADVNGKVLGVRVLAQQETPGYGARIVGDRAEWLQLFTGRTRDAPPLLRQDGGDIDAITGATVTSRSVTRAVAAALEAIESVRNIEIGSRVSSVGGTSAKP
jgi:electron transport complex protein RnfG